MTRPEPAASRPFMPGYGILPVDAGGGLLPWSWAVDRLERARRYWVATSCPDGAPHLTPVWGIWHDGAFWFSTGGRSRKARNLADDGRCTVAPESAEEAIVVEGSATRVTAASLLAVAQARYTDKYGFAFPDPTSNPLFRVAPLVAFAIIEMEPDFSGRATRWTFDARHR